MLYVHKIIVKWWWSLIYLILSSKRVFLYLISHLFKMRGYRDSRRRPLIFFLSINLASPEAPLQFSLTLSASNQELLRLRSSHGSPPPKVWFSPPSGLTPRLVSPIIALTNCSTRKSLPGPSHLFLWRVSHSDILRSLSCSNWHLFQVKLIVPWVIGNKIKGNHSCGHYDSTFRRHNRSVVEV